MDYASLRAEFAKSHHDRLRKSIVVTGKDDQTHVKLDYTLRQEPHRNWEIQSKQVFLNRSQFENEGALKKINQAKLKAKGRLLFVLAAEDDANQSQRDPLAGASFHVDSKFRMPTMLTAIATRKLSDPHYEASLAAAQWLVDVVALIDEQVEQLNRPDGQTARATKVFCDDGTLCRVLKPDLIVHLGFVTAPVPKYSKSASGNYRSYVL